LLDSHRPFNHHNVIDAANKIFVVDDNCKSFRECPKEEDARLFEELGAISSEGESDSDEAEGS